MHGGGEGRRQRSVHALHHVVAHEHERRARRNARLKGQKIALLKGLIGPLVDGDARVRVGVVPVAGEVLEDRRHPRVPDRADRRRHKFARRRGVSAERARVDEVARVGGYVAHRRKVHVDAERQKLLVIVQRLRGKTVHAARGIQLLRRGQRLREELRVAARARYRAALLVAADEERNVRRGLIALELRRQILRAQPAAVRVLVVPSEEQQPPEVVGSYILRRARLGTADKEHLPDLFLDRHPRDALAQPRLGLLGLARLRRRDRRRVDRRRRGVNDRRVRLRFARAAREQAQRRKQRKNSSFHRVFPSFVRALCTSLCRVSRLFP